ncbi:Ig-like domain-containing protein [Winogradskyella arenosi]|uniref:Putative secreted protein (Por secretion system target) n=1 Tax=Winogradskyella arenosi TaxID=533325 RepID=A0A368ZCJ5_9FLAO|nr:Ig-like domain-containing protein [Winogradskyella arenosi]RCW90763.1 putative secreted protein (Por secretion system target) [Winogradskyella arenosi]
MKQIIYLIFIIPFLCLSQQKAFPTAYGGGAYASGGRGGYVYHVTSLADDGSEGTFRWALSQPRPATIVFDVSGVINMENYIVISGEDLTIAGQTSPEGGITFTANNTQYVFRLWDVQNMILRYLRFRFQRDNNNIGIDVYGNHGNASDLMFDHLSISYSGWTGFGCRGSNNYNVTVQNTIFAECKTGAIFGDPDTFEFSYDNSFLNNFFYNVSHRFPNPSAVGRVDVINNVSQNHYYRLSRPQGSVQLNHINNYYAAGAHNNLPLSDMNQVNSAQDNTIYTSGNIMDKGLFSDADNSLIWAEFDSGNSPNFAPATEFVSTPYPLIDDTFTIKTAVEAYNAIINNPTVGNSKSLTAAGGTIENYDVNDAEYLAKTAEGEGAYEAYTAGQYGVDRSFFYEDRYYNFLATITGVPVNTRPDNFYVSNPHIPEVWFQAHVPEGEDHNDIAPSGYTWLEEYLNQVDAEAAIPSLPVESVTVSPESAELNSDDTLQLEVVYTPENATDQTGTWTTNDETVATVDDNGLVTAIAPGDAIITYTATDGNYTDTSQITVFPEALQASAGDDQQICPGESATLTASGGTTYVWSTGETTASITVTPEETTTYNVTVSDDYGQSADVEVSVELNAVPEADAGDEQTLCLGSSTTLTASGGTSYLWSTGQTTASIEVSPTEDTIYSVEVSNGNCSSTAEVNVTVNPAPELILTEDQLISEGTSVTLNVGGGETYLWSTGETSNTITVTPNTTTTYTVNATGPNGCTSSAQVTISVAPAINASAGSDLSICNGETVTLTASGGTSYFWSTGDEGAEINVNPTVTTTYTVTVEDTYGFSETDEVVVFVNDAPNITVSENTTIMQGDSVTLSANGALSYVWSTGDNTAEINVTPEDTTTYTVTGQSEEGCSTTAEVTVTVVAELSANAGDDETICLGESVTLNASGGIDYLWSTGNTGPTLTVTPSETTTYTVTVMDEFGNSDSDSVIVTVNEVPNANAGADQTICMNSETVLTAEGGESYLWSTGETTASITVSPIENTTYTVEVFEGFCSSNDQVTVWVDALPELVLSNDVTIIDGSSTVLEVSGAESYTWSTGATTATISVSPTETTTYSVTGISEAGCEAIAEVTVTVIPELNANAGNDVSMCSGESVTLTATGGETYAWDNGETTASITVSPLDTTTYAVTVFDAYGNSDSDTVTVTVGPLPSLSLSEDLMIMAGETAELTVSGTDSYTWSTGATTATISVSPTETTTYSVIGTSEAGCEATAEVTVTVIPELNANAGNDVSICSGESVTLTATGGETYTWDNGEATASITVFPEETTTYMVTVFDSYGNSDSDAVTVTVGALPTLSLSEDLTIMAGETTELTVSGADGYTWSTGETIATINVSPTSTTTYNVTGISESGCEATAEVTVTVIPALNANAGNDVSICSGESVTLTATGGEIYAWDNGVTTASITVAPQETTTYMVTVFDTFGNSNSDEVTVTVHELPVLSVSENVTLIEGESVTLFANGANSYSWNTGATSSAIEVSPTETTTYTVIGMSNSCSSELAEITVTVIPLFHASAGSDVSVCENDDYEVELIASEGESYLWSTGETTQSIVVSPLSTTTYSVTVTEGVQEDSDEVTVFVGPSPEVTITNGATVEILSGDFVTLSAQGANTYEWDNGATQPNIAVSPSTTTTYHVRGFIGNCYDDQEVTVNVIEPVVADAGEDVLICLDEWVTLEATGGDDYVWSTGETTSSITVSPEETTDYTVTVFNALDFDEATVQVEVNLNCTSGLPEDEEDEQVELTFEMYPNPASDYVNVKISGLLNVSVINIYEVTGKLVQQVRVTNEPLSLTVTKQIEVSGLQSGVYFIKLVDQERSMTKKLIVD